MSRKAKGEHAKSLRVHWSLIVGLMMACIIFLLTIVVVELEQSAWRDSQHKQSVLLVDRLGDALLIPMMSNSRTEAGLLVDAFFENTPFVSTVELQWRGQKTTHYGDSHMVPKPPKGMFLGASATRLGLHSLWYLRSIDYGQVHVGQIAVRFSGEAWSQLEGDLKLRLFIAAVVVVLLSCFLIYWVAGRMSRPIERLAQAEKHVANGNFSIRLPVQGNDEIAAATRQFNRMVKQLAHKEKVREQFNRYLNPKLVEKLFAEGGHLPKSHNQEVTVLFADMVNFTSYSQTVPAELVVEALNEHFELFHYIIEYFGGNIDKYIGDAVMVVFNHPFEDEDHTQHAVMTGLCMVEVCKRLAIARPDGGEIQFRVGLDKGDVIVGNLGANKRLEYTVIGNTVNVASRMAGIGLGVIASERVCHSLGFGFEMNDMGAQSIKGISKPIHCGQIVAVTKKLKSKVASVVDKAMAAKAQLEHEKSFYNDG